MEKIENIVVFVTCANREEGGEISNSLVEKKLVACVNLVPEIASRYWWQGKVETSREVLLIIKTKNSLLKKLISEVKKLHSYSVPEIIALPIIGGNKDYLDWIKESTKTN